MLKYKVLKDFDQAVDCRTIVSHAEDDLIDVPENKVDEWTEAGFIDEKPTNVKNEPAPETPAKEDEGKAGFFGGKKKKS